MWIKKCHDDSETVNWIKLIPSPVPLQLWSRRDGGCNHTTCSTCRFEVLLDLFRSMEGAWNWVLPMYNRFDPEVTSLIRRTRLRNTSPLGRKPPLLWAIHCTRVFGGRQKTIATIDTQMTAWTNKSVSKLGYLRIDIQFFRAIQVPIQGRKPLKWTCCFAYYAQLSNYSSLRGNARLSQLKQFEDLSRIFEDINSKRKIIAWAPHL